MESAGWYRITQPREGNFTGSINKKSLSNLGKTFNFPPRIAEKSDKAVRSREIISGAGQKWLSETVVV